MSFKLFLIKKTFERYLNDKAAIVVLSSWHYLQIAKQYDIEAKLVAQKKDSVTDTKVLIGKKGVNKEGIVTSAYDDEYTQELLNNLTKNTKFSVIEVPKEIDALMSVGFGMSQFALVSKDSFLLLKELNSYLAKDLVIYEESKPFYKMLIACKNMEQYKEELLNIFTKMGQDDNGKKILDILGIDKLVVLHNDDLNRIGGVK